ncbi:MAG: AEC family transporter [Bdellovibrionales bacterium]|nr:AEC family transporter [Bdellovibrionales bacterium]
MSAVQTIQIHFETSVLMEHLLVKSRLEEIRCPRYAFHMTAFILLFLCLVAGFALRQTGRLGDQGARALGTTVTYVFLPAVVLSQVHQMGGTIPSWIPALAGWALFLGSAAAFLWIGRRLKWSAALQGAVILSAGLGNTSFIGFPILTWLRGEESIPVAILADQFGAFLPLSTGGVIIAAVMGSKRARFKETVFRVTTFPPFIALVVALFTAGWNFPAALQQILDALSAAMIPTALVSVGAYLKFSGAAVFRKYRGPLIAGLSYKLVLAPLVLVLVLKGAFGLRGPFVDIGVLEAGMAPMISAALVAAEYDCEPELCNLMIAVGTPISLLTVPLLSLLLDVFA